LEHINHLSKDKKLKKVIESQPAFVLEKRNKVYLRLCSSILSQQLSTTVAKVLYISSTRAMDESCTMVTSPC